MFGMMKGKRIETSGNKMYPFLRVRDSSVRMGDDVGGLASKDKNNIAVMLWNYHDDDTTGAGEQVSVNIKDIPAKQVTITEYRIDKDYSNSYEVWKQMGSPKQPSQQQIATLEKAGHLQSMGKSMKATVKEGRMIYKTTLPRQAVSLLTLTW